MGHRRYGHQAMEPVELSRSAARFMRTTDRLVCEVLKSMHLAWDRHPITTSPGLMLMVGLIKRE